MVLIICVAVLLLARLALDMARLRGAARANQDSWASPGQWLSETRSGVGRLVDEAESSLVREAQLRVRISLVAWFAWLILSAALAGSLDAYLRKTYGTPNWVVAEIALAIGVLWVVDFLQVVMLGRPRQRWGVSMLGFLGTVIALVVLLLFKT